MKKIIIFIALFFSFTNVFASFNKDLSNFRKDAWDKIQKFINAGWVCSSVLIDSWVNKVYEQYFTTFSWAITQQLALYDMNFADIKTKKDDVSNKYNAVQKKLKTAEDKYFATSYGDVNYDEVYNTYYDLKKQLITLQDEYDALTTREDKTKEDVLKDEVLITFYDKSSLTKVLENTINDICSKTTIQKNIEVVKPVSNNDFKNTTTDKKNEVILVEPKVYKPTEKVKSLVTALIKLTKKYTWAKKDKLITALESALNKNINDEKKYIISELINNLKIK